MQMTPFLDANATARTRRTTSCIPPCWWAGSASSRPSRRGCCGLDGRARHARAIGALYVFAPRLPPEMIMRMYRARPLDPQQRRANRSTSSTC